MYQEPNISRFHRFHCILNSKPELGYLVRSLDLSRFQATIPIPIIQACLSAMPHLRQCRLTLEDLGDEGILETLFGKMHLLNGLEIETCHPYARREWLIPELIHKFFKNSCTSVGVSLTNLTCNLRYTPCSKMFEAMLPHMSSLRTLDVAHTDISCRALRRIATTARLTHLDVSHCRNIPGVEFAHFIVRHSAMKYSLVSLLASDVSYGGQLLTEREVTLILSNAPPTLRSLNLGFSEMNRKHLPYLRKLSSQLEELGVGRDLCLRDIEHVLMSSRYSFNAEDRHIKHWTLLEAEPKHESIFGPAKDAVAVCRLKQRLQSISPRPFSGTLGATSTVRYLDISTIPPQEQEKMKQTVLWSKESMPLAVIEVSGVKKCPSASFLNISRTFGWQAGYTDERCWLERKP